MSQPSSEAVRQLLADKPQLSDADKKWLLEFISGKKYALPDLPYAYNALEPVICEEIMTLHHKKHHQGYVNNFNATVDQLLTAFSQQDISTVVQLMPGLKFNGGGHVNHSIFWKNLSPLPEKGGKGGVPPKGPLLEAINKEWGSLDAFIQKFNTATAAVQGSGWGWLGFNKQTKRLEIVTTPNQDPLVLSGLVPLLGVDVWEHAYYLQYKNARPDYLKEIWKIVNWEDVSERYLAATSGSNKL